MSSIAASAPGNGVVADEGTPSPLVMSVDPTLPLPPGASLLVPAAPPAAAPAATSESNNCGSAHTVPKEACLCSCACYVSCSACAASVVGGANQLGANELWAHVSAFRWHRLLLVIKVGTSTLFVERQGRLDFSIEALGRLVDFICALRQEGHVVVLVTSGAVGAGCASLNLQKRPERLCTSQAVAAVGQCRLMRLYEDLFGVRDQKVAQLLVSRSDFLQQQTYRNFLNCMRSLLDIGVLPIVNENDSVNTEELRFGDNDTLAAHCAVAIRASFLFIMTDVDCLYTANPVKQKDASPVPFVDSLTDVYKYVYNSTGSWGSGGMYTKIVASKLVTNFGVHLGIVNGKNPSRILNMLHYVKQNLIEARELAHQAQPQQLHQQQCEQQQTLSVFKAGDVVGSESGSTAHPSKGVDLRFADDDECQEGGCRECANSERRAASPPSSEQVASSERQPGPLEYNCRNPFQLERVGKVLQAIDDRKGLNPEISYGDSSFPDSQDCTQGISPRHTHISPGAANKPAFDMDIGALISFPSPAKHSLLHLKFNIADEPAGGWNHRNMPFLGTVFMAKSYQESKGTRCRARRWILALPVKGSIFVNKDCAKKIVLHGKHLYASGITEVTGEFLGGECVSIYLENFRSGVTPGLSAEVGRLIVEYSAAEIKKLIHDDSANSTSFLGWVGDTKVAPRQAIALVYMNGEEQLRKIFDAGGIAHLDQQESVTDDSEAGRSGPGVEDEANVGQREPGAAESGGAHRGRAGVLVNGKNGLPTELRHLPVPGR